MTTIIAVKDKKTVTFGWDSQTTWLGRGMNGGQKVFRNGAVVFGVSGLGRMSDILRFLDVPAIRTYEPDFDTEHWIVTSLVPAILKAASDAQVAEVINAQANTESSVIISVNGVVGYLSGNLSFVTDETGVYGVGSGSDYAIGALRAGASVQKAVEIARELDLYTGGGIAVKTVEELMA